MAVCKGCEAEFTPKIGFEKYCCDRCWATGGKECSCEVEADD